jgi:integrase
MAARRGAIMSLGRWSISAGTIAERAESSASEQWGFIAWRTLDAPCHPVLRQYLDDLKRVGMVIVMFRGRQVPYLRFNERWRRITERAGIEGAQARDLRRTAMLRMAEAGATVPQIASVSGHSIEQTQRILNTYLPRNRDLAEIAIARLADYKRIGNQTSTRV